MEKLLNECKNVVAMKLSSTITTEDGGSIFYYSKVRIRIKVTKIAAGYGWEIIKGSKIEAVDTEGTHKTVNAAKLNALKWVKDYI